MVDEQWKKIIGRVAFLNCDPLFHGLSKEWNVLPAPPSWLTGHLLRRDCVLAPIPAADYARNADELVLVPEIGICSKGEVGSVLVFGSMPIKQMKSIALPTDSQTSVALLKYILNQEGLEPETILMGPDLDSMLEACDGALLIGDRALEGAKASPESVQMDLGQAWLHRTSKPMVFGVFAARRDTPIEDVRAAQEALLERLMQFETQPSQRQAVIEWSMSRSDLDYERLNRYFGEVFNRLDGEHKEGLEQFLVDACGLTDGSTFAW
ncbi:menaquinone biosynthesis protein [Candidatus Poseidoniaceae archaeon]|jgi:chorismate dehydratase|nr:menaquinone biosynthesis protein [Candidatus Poseidoniaceae archaeon]|tara:strand:- start:9375 stop:10172 length:798 start_codon:yes stop_codon:yes gene_type:complete